MSDDTDLPNLSALPLASPDRTLPPGQILCTHPTADARLLEFNLRAYKDVIQAAVRSAVPLLDHRPPLPAMYGRPVNMPRNLGFFCAPGISYAAANSPPPSRSRSSSRAFSSSSIGCLAPSTMARSSTSTRMATLRSPTIAMTNSASTMRAASSASPSARNASFRSNTGTRRRTRRSPRRRSRGARCRQRAASRSSWPATTFSASSRTASPSKRGWAAASPSPGGATTSPKRRRSTATG